MPLPSSGASPLFPIPFDVSSNVCSAELCSYAFVAGSWLGVDINIFAWSFQVLDFGIRDHLFVRRPRGQCGNNLGCGEGHNCRWRGCRQRQKALVFCGVVVVMWRTRRTRRLALPTRANAGAAEACADAATVSAGAEEAGAAANWGAMMEAELEASFADCLTAGARASRSCTVRCTSFLLSPWSSMYTITPKDTLWSLLEQLRHTPCHTLPVVAALHPKKKVVDESGGGQAAVRTERIRMRLFHRKAGQVGDLGRSRHAHRHSFDLTGVSSIWNGGDPSIWRKRILPVWISKASSTAIIVRSIITEAMSP